MIKPLLQVTGWLCAAMPEFVLRILAELIAVSFYYGVPSRRRLIHSNLHHAFPDRPREWRRRMARECIRRFAETGLLSLATPYLPAGRLKKIITASASMRAAYASHRATPKPTLICTPHLAYWEVLTAMPLIEQPFPEFGAIFRPLDNPAADAFVKSSRERFGMKLLSRKDGFQEAVRILRRNGLVGILYDQNAGSQGALTLLFDRVCSTTELVGLLAQKFSGQCVGLYARRLGFWRVEICMETVATDGTSEGATIGLNRWLEQMLRSDENMCASWLWGHQRWKNQDAPAARLRLEQKRNLLPAELRYRNLPQLPRKTRFWIRLPNWLGDVVMALPLLRAIRRGRPDAEITLIAKPQYGPLLEKLGVADRVLPLPRKGAGYFVEFWRRREEFPDCTILFTNSARGDLEAWLTRSRQRFGVVRPGKPRPLLSHCYKLGPDFDQAKRHQLEMWTLFLQHFGLAEKPDVTPFAVGGATRSTASGSADAVIGLICGSENNP
jgi:heptosyltransferase II